MLLGPEICCTPAPQKPRDDRKLQTAKNIASMLKNSSAISSKKQLPKSQAKSAKPSSVRRCGFVCSMFSLFG